jgi:hypothetical protein
MLKLCSFQYGKRAPCKTYLPEKADNEISVNKFPRKDRADAPTRVCQGASVCVISLLNLFVH